MGGRPTGFIAGLDSGGLATIGGGPAGFIAGLDTCGPDIGCGMAWLGMPWLGMGGGAWPGCWTGRTAAVGGPTGGIPGRLTGGRCDTDGGPWGGGWAMGGGWVTGGSGRLPVGWPSGRWGSPYPAGGRAGGWAEGPTGRWSPPRRPVRGGSGGCWSSRIGSSLPLSDSTRSMIVWGALFSSSSGRRRRRRGASPPAAPYSASSSATVRCGRSEPLSRVIISTVPRVGPSVQ
jgi:hypothetical protein